MNEIKSTSDFDVMFAEPFKARKLLYSLNFLSLNNDILKAGYKQVAADLDESHYKCMPEFPCGEVRCRSTFRTIRDYDIHCQSMHRYICSECKKSFTTYNMLDVHIQEKHDSYHKAAKARNLAKFHCFVQGCNEVFPSANARDAHVIGNHNYPSNFKFQSLKPEFEPEDMELNLDEQISATATERHRPRVPRNVCFGRGSARTFKKASRGKPSKDISMKELADAL